MSTTWADFFWLAALQPIGELAAASEAALWMLSPGAKAGLRGRRERLFWVESAALIMAATVTLRVEGTVST
jgi:hypothetical protein